MNDIKQCFKQYIGELHEHLFNNLSINQIIKDMDNSHRKKRFISMFLIQDKETFDMYYEQRGLLGLSDAFNQVIQALLLNHDSDRLKQLFVIELGIHEGLVEKNVSTYRIKEIEKDLRAFSFYQTKIELKKEID